MKNAIQISLIAIFLKSASLFASDTITLDLSNPTKPAEFTLTEKGYWTETYNTAEEYRFIEFDLFRFTHILHAFGGTDVGGGMSYWDGFTFSINGDTTNFGQAGSSDGWVPNQWGNMAGGGIKTDENGAIMYGSHGKPLVEKGIPYLVAYWGYWEESNHGGEPCLQITFTDGNMYQPVGVYINNHPWPYWGNIYGDGFARPFGEGDYFKLYIHGLNEAGQDIGITIEHTLAEFKDGKLHQSRDWEWVDLSPLGVVSGIYFTMYSTDSLTGFGPNTAVYFCLDKLQVCIPQETTAPTRPTGLQSIAHETAIDLSWTPSTGTAGIKGYNLYLDNAFAGFVGTTQYRFTNLQPFTTYLLSVEAVANDDTPSDRASLSVQTTDETPPTPPTNLRGTGATLYTLTIAWDASTDNDAVRRYSVYIDGQRRIRPTTTTATLDLLDPGTTYLIEVEAEDHAGNFSERASVWLTTSGTSSTIDKINDTDNPGALIRIYDIMGRTIPKQDIWELPAGLYILQYENRTIKIIRN